MTSIPLLGLALGLLLMLIPLLIFSRLRVPLVHSTLQGLIRMIVQLYLVGLYLQYLFQLDRWWINLLWALIMTCVATGTALQRTRLRPSMLAVPFFAGFLVGGVLVGFYFLACILQLDNIFEAQYFIPIFGLLLGNMLGVNILALDTFVDSLHRGRHFYYCLLGNGATTWEASLPSLRSAIQKAFNPCIANMAVMGLVSMPGTMIGQILGGSSPATAIRYQMMIVIITFVASIISLLTTLLLVRSRLFDQQGRITIKM